MILSELKNLYNTDGNYGLYTTLYDFLIKDGHDLNISADVKEALWKKSVDKFNVVCKRIVESGEWSKEQMTAELHKYYKSHLAAEYLLRVKRDTGQTLDIKDEEGNKIQLITFK
jgi:hypothetical protein